MCRIRRVLTLSAFLLTPLLLAPGLALAGEPRLISSSGSWAAYEFADGNEKVCYMASQPTKDEGDYKKRGEIFALVTHRPESGAKGEKNVFSYLAGYEYKPSSEVTLTIDSRKFTLFTQGETAWAPDAETDNEIAAALRKGSKMVVKGTSSRGTTTTDTFTLKGSGAAHDAISKACGIR